jgi:hypothetical protein
MAISCSLDPGGLVSSSLSSFRGAGAAGGPGPFAPPCLESVHARARTLHGERAVRVHTSWGDSSLCGGCLRPGRKVWLIEHMRVGILYQLWDHLRHPQLTNRCVSQRLEGWKPVVWHVGHVLSLYMPLWIPWGWTDPNWIAKNFALHVCMEPSGTAHTRWVEGVG